MPEGFVIDNAPKLGDLGLQAVWSWAISDRPNTKMLRYEPAWSEQICPDWANSSPRTPPQIGMIAQIKYMFVFAPAVDSKTLAVILTTELSRTSR